MKKIIQLISLFYVLMPASHGFGSAEPMVLDFELRANLITVEVDINGVPRKFILDTGASNTTIARQAAHELALKDVEKGTARGAGGEIEISLVRVDSFTVKDYPLHDFTCGVADLCAVSSILGNDISGVLGYDFLSKFEITINYQQKHLILKPVEQEALKKYIIEDNRFTSPMFMFELHRPDDAWDFVTETPLPHAITFMKKAGTSGTITVQVRELHGLTLEQVIPIIESSIPAQIGNYTSVSETRTNIGQLLPW